MQFRNGRNRQYRVLRSVNHPPRRGNEGWPGLENGLKWRVESAYLNYNIPTSWAQESCPVGRPTCPFRPASRNLINLPVASSLAPCRRSEILYPSHPLKPTTTPRALHTIAFGSPFCLCLFYPLSSLLLSLFLSSLAPEHSKPGSCSCNATRAPLNCSDIIEFYPDIDTRNCRVGDVIRDLGSFGFFELDICETFCFFLLLLWFFCYLFSFFLEILFRFQLMNGGKI